MKFFLTNVCINIFLTLILADKMAIFTSSNLVGLFSELKRNRFDGNPQNYHPIL